MAALKRKDVWAGLLLIGFGALGLLLGAELPIGTSRRIGPGYFPFGLSVLVALFGAIIAIRGLVAGSEAVEPMRVRPLIGIVAGGVLFALLIGSAGLVLATAAAIAGAALADRTTRWHEAALLAVCAVVFCTVVFVKLLGVPMAIWFP